MHAAADVQQPPQHAEPQAQQEPVRRGPFAWLRRLRRHKQHLQQQQQAQPAVQQQQHQQLHRLGSMEVPKGSDSSLQPLAPAVVDHLSASANVWALASHLYWGIWAIIQVGAAGWKRRKWFTNCAVCGHRLATSGFFAQAGQPCVNAVLRGRFFVGRAGG